MTTQDGLPFFEELSPLPGQVAPFQPTSKALIDEILDTLNLSKDDILMDLGCGNGKICLRAAARGIKCIGVDINPELIAIGNEQAASQGLEALVHLYVRDFNDGTESWNFDNSTVIVIYMIPEPLKPHLARYLKENPSVRIVTVLFPLQGWNSVMEKKNGNLHFYDRTSFA